MIEYLIEVIASLPIKNLFSSHGSMYPQSARNTSGYLSNNRSIRHFRQVFQYKAYKLMGIQIVEEGGISRNFYHPYMQAFTMALGELLCLAIYYSNLQKYKKPLEEGKTQHTFLHFLVPGIWDITLSVMQYIALNFISGSTFKLLQGGSIITTAIFSKILLNMALKRNHFIGCSLAVIGITIVGTSDFVIGTHPSDKVVGLQILGVIVMVTSLVFEGYKYGYEQRLMQRHSIHYFQLVGWEGFFGVVIIIVLSLIFSITPCPFAQDLCVYDDYGHTFIERVDVFFIQICQDWVLATLIVSGTLCCLLSNSSGVAITKYFDALTRCLLSMSKTAVVWIVGIIVTFSVGDNQQYQLQSKSFQVHLVKALGFTCIIIGTLIYNQLIFTKYFAPKDELPSQKLLISAEISQSEATIK